MSIEAECGDEDGRFKAIFSCVPECVKRVAADGRLIDINPAGLAMIEASSLEEVRGRDLLDLIDPAYREAFRDAIASVFAGRPVQLQFEVIGLAGRRLWMDQSAAPLFDRAGNVVEMVAVTRDLTAQRIAEGKLLRAKVAEEVARTRSLFLANVGNELKSPLNQIVGYGELLKELALEQSRHDEVADIDKILDASARLLSMINQMLAVSLAEARRAEPEGGAFDLFELIDDAVARINPFLQAVAARTLVEVGQAPQMWTGDRLKIDECLTAALSAAAEFAGAGTISVSALAVFEKGSTQLQLEIRARGERLGAGAVRDSSGSNGAQALGASRLELARSTARLMGGDLRIAAEPQGARLTVLAPACPQEREPLLVAG
jgi:PAS domain S-box-containing protein